MIIKKFKIKNENHYSPNTKMLLNEYNFYGKPGFNEQYKNITFPYSSNTTSLFLKALLTGKNQFMPSARIDFNISTFILSFLKVRIY